MSCLKREGFAMDSADRATPSAAEPRGLPWTTVRAEARRVGTGPRRLYDAVRRGQLRAVCINERGDLRLLPAWTDAWLLSREVR